MFQASGQTEARIQDAKLCGCALAGRLEGPVPAFSKMLYQLHCLQSKSWKRTAGLKGPETLAVLDYAFCERIQAGALDVLSDFPLIFYNN
jgi:hypothetical protein